MGDVRKASVIQEQAFQPHNMSDIIMAILVIAVLFVLSNFWRGKASTKRKSTFQPILDNFKTIEEVQKALREAGLEASQLIVGIDYTKSNEWQGQKTFGGRCLHHLGDKMDPNPYQHVISVMAKTLDRSMTTGRFQPSALATRVPGTRESSDSAPATVMVCKTCSNATIPSPRRPHCLVPRRLLR